MNKIDKYIEGSVEVPLEIVDPVCNYIIENITNGLVLEDEEDSTTTNIMFYLPAGQSIDFKPGLTEYVESLKEMNPDLSITSKVKSRTLENIEWEEAYKRSVPAVKITDYVCVRPPWENKLDGTKYDIMIEPKMAFGTGTHETTQGCLVAVQDNFISDMSFLDVGCGSGILSVLAAKMGASYIKAIDYDIIAVENSIENFELNSVPVKCDVLHGSIEQCDNDPTYDFVCANIIRETILQMLSRLKELTKPAGVLVLSGLMDKDCPEIIEALEKESLNDYKIIEKNEWRTFVIHKG